MTLDQLRSAGFQQRAVWCRDKSDEVICRDLEGIPDSTGLYLFCIQTEVRYVGSALGNLRRRMRNYQRRQRQADPAARFVHAKLRESILRKNVEVQIYTREIHSKAFTEWDGLPVSVILGAEHALIKTIAPKWNRYGLCVDKAGRPLAAGAC